MFDLIIIGSGPAGLSAAIYAQRAMLDAVVIEKGMSGGGQMLETYDVDNYPGFYEISGYDLAMKMHDHAEKLGTAFITDKVLKIDDKGLEKEVICENDTYTAYAVIVASGAEHQKLGVPGEELYKGRGVSYCATCDGAFFRKKTCAVIGGGNVALEDAIFLSRLCEKVYLIIRRDVLRGAKSLQETVFNTENISILRESVVESIEGGSNDRVSSLKIRRKKDDVIYHLPVDGVFIAVGIAPNSGEFEGLVDMENGYIAAGEDCVTSAPGIFAAGDVRTKTLKQIVTAAADGANAVTSVEKYLNELIKR